ncbi:hypothetical protein CAEBREN_16314 [Caenorhabditis brenneri]|uniref:Uncharacterized protein n=1 Tax=Caenorhabditis brenneri TaxID=135651 RepID=G0P682_CAEBE|nr:hypothetical protein CAEBREN_16314 [Caenorhabditis brenneri]
MGNTQATPEKNSMEKEAKKNAASSSTSSNSSNAKESTTECLKRLQSTAASIHQQALEALADLPPNEEAQARQIIISEMITALNDYNKPMHRAQTTESEKQQEVEAMTQQKATKASTTEKKKKEDIRKEAILSFQNILGIIANVPPNRQEECLKILALQELANRQQAEAMRILNPAASLSQAAYPDAALEFLLDTVCHHDGKVSSIVKHLSQKLQNLKKESEGDDDKETGDDMQNTPSTSGPPTKKTRMSSEHQ